MTGCAIYHLQTPVDSHYKDVYFVSSPIRIAVKCLGPIYFATDSIILLCCPRIQVDGYLRCQTNLFHCFPWSPYEPVGYQ